MKRPQQKKQPKEAKLKKEADTETDGEQQSPAWLIVGLGNPGVKYAETRHNTGWVVCSALCAKYELQLIPGMGSWFSVTGIIGSTQIAVALPTTYMNNSGEAVAELQRLFSLKSTQIVIVYDEYNYSLGVVKLKPQGSDGGHNGVASVIEHLQTEKFWRLRCGIGRNFGDGGLVDYVLSPFMDNELEHKDAMVINAVKALELLFAQGAQRTISEVNSGQAFE